VRPALVAAAILIAAACGPSTLSRSITVFAAASLTDAFKAVGGGFEREHPGTTVTFNFAGTPTLVTQIEQGAHADVFASADMVNMDRLEADGLTTSATPQVFAHNRLEIVVARGNPRKISALADLGKPGVIYIAEAPTVPAGKYSLQALARAGVTVKPKSLEANVKSVVSKIELGEADVGIVYTTDVRAAGDKVTGVPIPDEYNVVATYPIAAVKGTTNTSTASDFIDFVTSGAGQAILGEFGFDPA
jgi:molybdate transport system substrate-binding protein